MHRFIFAAALAGSLLAVSSTQSGAAEVLRYEESIFDADVDPMDGLPGMWAINGLAVSPDGKQLYVVSQIDSILTIFDRDLVTGALTLQAQIPNSVAINNALSKAHWIAISSDGKFLYVSPGGSSLSGVAVFSRDLVTGALTYVEVERHVTLQGEITLALSPNEQHLYAIARGTNAIGVFARDATTGALTFLESHVDGGSGGTGLAEPLGVDVSVDGKHVYVAAFADSAVTIFDRDQTTGLLTLNDTLVDGAPGYAYFGRALGVHALADGRILINAFDDDLTVYDRNAVSGALTLLAGPASGGSGAPQYVAVDEERGRVYASVWVTALDTFSWNTETAELAFLDRKIDGTGGVDGIDGMQGIAFSPDGNDVYTGSFYDQALSHFRLACGNGSPDSGEACDDGNNTGLGCCTPLCGVPPATGCLAAPKASFQVKDSADSTKDQIKWKWSNGDAFDQNALGDPLLTGDTGYSLCVYDETAGVPALATYLHLEPFGAWQDTSPKGLKYLDKTGAQDGVQKAQLKTGVASKTSARISAKGVNVAMPTPFGGGSYFDSDPRVTVRLVNDEGTCWLSEFPTATKNEPTQFKAKTP